MEDKKASNSNLTAFLLFIILVLIIGFSCIIFMLYNKINDQSAYSSHPSGKAGLEDILIDSDYGKMIASFIESVWCPPETYLDCIPEFDNVKDAPIDYLAVCSAFKVEATIYDGDIYGAKKEFSEFNNALVSLFGEEADGLIKKSDLEDVFFVTLNPDGKTYSFSGFDGSEGSSTQHLIRNIEQDGDLFYVYQYEYKSVWDTISVDLGPGDETTEHIYDIDKNPIVDFHIEYMQEGNTIYFKILDNNGVEVNSVENYILSHYQDKLTLRKLVLKYDSKNYSFSMLSNKIIK